MTLKKIVFVSHCVLNTGAKVAEAIKGEVTEEELCRKRFLYKAIEEDIQIIQLPCPEFNLYGAKRWGHSKEQFDNPFYRDSCRNMLKPYLLQMKEYINNGERFQVIGVIGIEGSPSCGVNLTYCGEWGGELSSNPNLKTLLEDIGPKKEKGVFMEVLEELLKENGLTINFLGLSEIGLKEFEEVIK